MGNDRIKKYYDLVIIGGGISGLCAAVAAARNGIKAAIINDRPVFGGNSSSEVGIGPIGSVYYNSWSAETGIVEELLLHDRVQNHESLSDAGRTNSIYDLTLYQAAKSEKNLDIYLNTSVRQAETESKADGIRIDAVYGSQMKSEKEFIFYAKQFCDCTGDGTIGFLAGAEFRYGREARDEFGEFLAPRNADGVIMGSSIALMARNVGKPVQYKKPDWVMEYSTMNDIGLLRDISCPQKETYSGFWWMEVGNPYHQVDNYDDIREELLKHTLGVWNYIKNHSEFRKAAANYALEWIGMLPGKRESRRLAGDVIVTENHCQKNNSWPDSVCNSGWFLDVHIKGGILNKVEPPELSHTDANYKNYTLVSPFTLPLRAFYSRNIKNLWMAGRDISVTHAALASVRVQMTLGNIGQAVGTAAAYAVKNGLTPRQAANPQLNHVKEIQQQLLKDDVNILGVINEDPYDMARYAEALASSEQELDFKGPDVNDFVELDKPRAQVLPITTDYIEYMDFYVKNSSDSAKKVDVEVQKLEKIWDKGEGTVICEAEMIVEEGYSGFVRCSINSKVEPFNPYRVILNTAEGISWAKALTQPPGTLAQYFYSGNGGCELKNIHMPSLQIDEIEIPAFKKWNEESRNPYSLCLNISSVQKPYGASNVNNGSAWPCSMPNLWRSNPGNKMPQHVTLDFKDVKRFNCVHVSFDTNLNLAHSRMQEFWKSPECAKDWKLYAEVDGAWKEIYSETGNYLRKRVVCFDEVSSRFLKLQILSTNGGECAGIYEIRVYKE